MSNLAIQAEPLEAYACTPDGQRASFTDANGNATAYAYDGFDRLASATYPDTSTEDYTYDANDNVLTRETRAGDAITFTYDTLNRLASKAAPGQPTVTYAYDLAGRLTAANDNSSAIACETYRSGGDCGGRNWEVRLGLAPAGGGEAGASWATSKLSLPASPLSAE